MKNLSEKIFIFVFFALSFFSVSELQAQTTRTVGQAVEAAVSRSLESRTRSSELERMKDEAERGMATERQPTKKFPEIKEDFEQIQTVNFDSLQTESLKNAPDYKTIYKAAAEIKKRANRLKKNLFPQGLTESVKSPDKDAEKTARIDLSKADFKLLSVALDNAIYRFVSNNIFRNIMVVNSDDSVKAQIELNEIIKICSLLEDKSKN